MIFDNFLRSSGLSRPVTLEATRIYSMFINNSRSYILVQTLTIVFNLAALVLCSNSVKGLRVTEIPKQIKFKGVSDELAPRKWFQRQPVTKYL